MSATSPTSPTSPTAANMACIGEPISWPRLERFALERSDTRIGEHVAACPACRACLAEIERDVVALPALHVPVKRARRWWTFALPAGVAIAAAALALLVLRPRDPALAEGQARVKGLGTVEIDVVRERAGTIRDDVRTFAAGDRFKVVVTCAADKSAWIDAFVVEAGAARPDFPLEPARIVCGNRIPLAGAFTLTGDEVHRVCIAVATESQLDRTSVEVSAPGVACLTLRPE